MTLTNKSDDVLRQALEACCWPVPDYWGLREWVRGMREERDPFLDEAPRPVAPWLAQEMLRWCADEATQKTISLEEYACALSRADWPPPPFMSPLVYMYTTLATTQSESIMDLRDLAERGRIVE